MSISAVSFGNEPQQKSSALPLATTLIGGAVGGLVIQEKVTGKDVLKKDTFELKGKKVAEEDTAVAAKINEKLTPLKAETIGATADAEVAKKFGEKEVLTAEEYLPKDFEAGIAAKEGETAEKQSAFDNAKAAKETAEKGTDDAVKARTKTNFETAEKDLKAHKNAIAADKAELEFATKAKEGITKDAYKSKVIADIKNVAKTEVDELLATLKKIPKKPSIKMGLIGAGIGLLIGLIMKPSKKAAPAEEPKA